MPPTKLSPEKVAEIHHRAKSGEHVSRLALEVGLTTTNLGRLLRRRYGFESPRLHPRKLLPIPNSAARYIAGLIDGEGSVHFRKQDRKTRPYVTISMSDREPLEYVAQFGGNLYSYQPSGGRKRMHRFQLLGGEDVRAFLGTISPYLLVPGKRQRATKALEFFANAPKTARGGWDKDF